MRLSKPIFSTKTTNPTKFAEIASDYDKPPATGVRRDHQIIRADHLALPFKFGTDLAVVRRRLRIEEQNIKACGKRLYPLPMFGWLR